MTGRTKMIILTSDEDIIRQFSLDNTTNTRIIDWDAIKKLSSNEINEETSMNLTFLTQLSKLSSTTNQVSKRAIDSPRENSSKPVKASKKSRDIICTICGDEATGFNYDVLTCASCKAFFRRNANQPPEKIRCLTGEGRCLVSHEIHRKCQKCRLGRCLALGMRKDFILTEEEKQRRKQRVEQNRKQTAQRTSSHESLIIPKSESLPPTTDEFDCFLMDVNKMNEDDSLSTNGMEDILFGTLSIEDWITIQSVQSSFVSNFHLSTEQIHLHTSFFDRTSALISWSEFINQVAVGFINFIRQINEFQGLTLDDRIILIKYNLPPVFPICKCYNLKYTSDWYSSESCEEAEKHRQFFKLFDAPTTVLDTFRDVVLTLVQITKQDPTLLSLLLIILVFTPGLSMNDEEPPLKDPLAVHRIQSQYTKILWNYLVSELGEMDACRRFTQLLTIILRLQARDQIMRLFFREQFIKANTVDMLAPLMQTVLNIS